MAQQFEHLIRTELTVPLQLKQLGASFFTQDNKANRIIAEVYKNNALQTLTGSVRGYVMRSDSTTVFFPGMIENGRAVIELPKEAYAVIGNVTIAIRLTDTDGTVTTVALVGAYVKRYTTDAYVDGGHVISNVDDLIENLNKIELLANLIGQAQGIVQAGNTLADRAQTAMEVAQASAQAAAASEAAAESYARLTAMDAVTHGIFHLYIDERGHLIYARADSLEGMTMTLQNGRLVLQYELEE